MFDYKPVNTGRLDDYGNSSASTLRKMLRITFVYVEGPSDARFYKSLMEGTSSLHFVDGRWCAGNRGLQKRGGCDFVLKAWGEYCGGGLTEETVKEENADGLDCIFCIDRDFRELLGIPPKEDWSETLFYQLCTGKYGKGYNDLECVLVSLPVYELALTTEYKIPIELARDMLDHAIHVAAILGCYRMGNRFAKGDDEQGNIFWQDNRKDDVDTDGRSSRKEMGVFYLFQCEAAKVSDGLVNLDEAALQRSLHYMSSDHEKIERALDKTREYKNQMKAANKLDYCRGHDITHLLCMELRDKLHNSRLTVKNVEEVLAKPMSAKNIAQQCRQFLSEYEFVKKLEVITN